MSDLRDARLQRALDAAPDAQPTPAAGTRQAIRRAARAALQTEPRAVWWRRWWAGSGRQRMPWNAAFASVLLASLVTVLWREQDMSEAAMEDARRDATMPTGNDSGGVVAGSAPAPEPAPIPAVAPAVEPPGVKPATPSPVAPDKQNKPGTDTRAATASTRPSTVEPERLRRDASQATVGPQPAPAQAAGPATPAAERQQATTANATEPARRSEKSSVETSVAAGTPQAAGAAAAPPPPRTAARLQVAPAEWTRVRIGMDGRRLELPRDQAAQLANLLNAVVALADSDEPLTGPVVARIETLRGPAVVGVLELAPPQVRWTPQSAAGAARTARPDTALLQALQDELLRLTAPR